MGFGILGCKRFSPAVRVSLMKVLWRVAAWDGGRGRGAFARQGRLVFRGMVKEKYGKFERECLQKLKNGIKIGNVSAYNALL